MLKYFKSPHKENFIRNNESWTPERDLENLKNLLSKEKDIFEIGFNLGERLAYLNAIGGVEFDPMFGTYGNNHFQIYNKYIIHLTELNEWFQQKREVLYTYHWLENFNDEDRQILINKIKENCTGKIYFLENFKIEDTLDIDGVQIYDCSNRR
jgi:hypothetical protein